MLGLQCLCKSIITTFDMINFSTSLPMGIHQFIDGATSCASLVCDYDLRDPLFLIPC